VDGPERMAHFKSKIEGSYSGYSLVAAEPQGGLIGFLLAEPWSEYKDDERPAYIHLAYAGVTKSHRQAGVFRRLIETAKAYRFPLFAEVMPKNASNMQRILESFGFVPWEAPTREGFMWLPTVAVAGGRLSRR
jgi:GNAT superfamily N-acetyltransferase